MKENESKKDNIYISILIAIIFSIFVGIRIYTKHMEKQVQESMERIMLKNIEDHGTPYFNH